MVSGWVSTTPPVWGRPSETYMMSALNHSDVIDKYVKGELAAGRIIGPMAISLEAARGETGASLHLNWMGVVP